MAWSVANEDIVMSCREDQRFTEIIYGGIHACFLLLLSLVLVMLGCYTHLRNYSSRTLTPYQGHEFKWVLSVLLGLVLLCGVGEGVLTELTRNFEAARPHLYVPQSCALLCALISLVYYHHMEYWNRPRLVWLLLLYWSSAVAIDVVRLVNLTEERGFDISLMRCAVIFTSVVIYACMFILEVNVIRTKVFGWCHPEKDSHVDLKKKRLFYHFKYKSLMSRLMYSTMNWLFVLGYKQPLEMNDLGSIPEDFGCKNAYNVFVDAYNAEKERASKKNTPPSLWRTYWNAYGWTIFTGVCIKAIADACILVYPLAIGGIVSYADVWYSGKEVPVDDECYVTLSEFFGNGFVLVVVMFFTVMARGFFLQYGGHKCDWMGIQARTALQAYTYEKSLRLSTSALSSGEITVGEITNHMSVDAMAVFFFTQLQPAVWPIPFLIFAILVMLYIKMGVSALIGASFLLVFVPAQLILANMLAKRQGAVLKISDERLKKINELIQGIKLLKLYGWEDMFCSAIEVVRGKQIRELFKLGFNISVMYSLSIVTTAIVTLIAFVAYSFISPDPLTPDLAFEALAFFSQMTLPIVVFVVAIRAFADGIPSMKRLRRFFVSQEIGEEDNGLPPMSRGFGDVEIDDDVDNDSSMRLESTRPRVADPEKYDLVESGGHFQYGTFQPEPSFVGKSRSPLPEHISVEITQGNFAWSSDGITLSDIDFQALVGSLVMVIGLVGSGKSSLLASMLGEMTTVSGLVQFNRQKHRVAYVPQKAWLQNATLRDNILFGRPLDHKRYSAVIEACALQPDIDILPAGDLTEIGEKGINLSGGQKQRISVARAIYSDTDIVLLDDPLSALDVHVGSHLVEHGIMDLLVGQGRTVILVTHQLQYLNYANKVILMDDGKISKEGDLNVMRTQDPGLFASWQQTIRTITESENESETENELSRSTEIERLKLQQDTSKETQERDSAKGSDGALIEKEERETGSVSWRMYRTYARAVKYPLVALVVALLVAQAAFFVASNFWLSAWSEAGSNIGNKTEEEIDDETRYYRLGFTALTLAFIIFLVAFICAQVMCGIFAARRIHMALLRNVIHAPMRFFDTTPVGRILNRFSYDTQVIDQKLWWTFLQTLYTGALCFSALVVNSIVTPVFLLAVAPLVVVYYYIQKYYIATSREIQRLDSISKSPVFAHFSESLGGLSVIRAYRDERRFRKRLLETVNTNNAAALYFCCSFRWLTVRMEIVGAFIVFASGLAALISCMLGAVPPSWVGLALTYSISICGQLNWMIRMYAECEMNMNAVERVDYYTKVETEEYRGVYNPPPDWPDRGRITFDNVSVRYAAELEPVLENINVNFKAGEKIGICGRTGSGKSSLTLALFRIIDTFKGRIIIDGVDISTVPLATLRRRLVIIPQDPVLFAGNIRFNLDPDHVKSDSELWEALEIAQLKETVADLENQLDSDVSEAGENFSVGQRQLFCLARAFLRNAKILVMDEATASIDAKTDSLLQNVITTAFANRTVLTIAHRISTILNSDNVLVMSEGRVVEYGPPEKLQNQDGSEFAALVKGHY